MLTPVGKPTRQELLMPLNFKSIGRPNLLFIRRGNIALAGIQKRTANGSPLFVLCLNPKPAWLVPAAPNAQKRRTLDELWYYVQKDGIKSYRWLGKDNRPKPSSKSIASGVGLKVRYPKQSVEVGCAAPCMREGHRPTYKILPLLLPPTSSFRSTG
jgi:hypothetical protein